MWKHRRGNGKDKGLYARLAELLRNSRYEEQHRRPEWMAVPPDTDVYLETMEVTKDTEEKAVRIGIAGMGSM